MNICDYGCGRPARNFKTYAKRWCCEKTHNSCPAIREKHRNPDVLKVRREGVRRKYGVDNVSGLQAIKDKKIATCLKNHGVEHPQQSKDVRAKAELTNLERYGVPNPLQNADVKAKSVVTCQKLYGVSNGAQSLYSRAKIAQKKLSLSPDEKEKVRVKRERSCLELYGVRNVSQNEEIHYSKLKTSFSKQYVFPSGRIVDVQGYEPKVLDDLLKSGIMEGDIKIGRREVPMISYYYEGKTRRYFPDIFVASHNWIIEVKSLYTFQLESEKNKAKRVATKNSGYSFSFVIR